MQQSIFIQLQHRIFSFNKYIHSTSTQNIFIQRLYSFNFNKYIDSTSTRAIFVQEEYLFNFNAQSYVLWNEYIYSTSTKIFSFNKNIHSTLRKFPDIENFLFNKAPPPYPTATVSIKQGLRTVDPDSGPGTKCRLGIN